MLSPGRRDDGHGPLVYVSSGSLAAGVPRFRGLSADVVAALADVPARVLLTVGEAGDREALEPLPPHVHVERWWPQRDVMPQASAMAGHGGFGTTMEGLASGVPMVVVPLFASDQILNAVRVQETGAGIALEAPTRSPHSGVRCRARSATRPTASPPGRWQWTSRRSRR